jgi:hypothetical protein
LHLGFSAAIGCEFAFIGMVSIDVIIPFSCSGIHKQTDKKYDGMLY